MTQSFPSGVWPVMLTPYTARNKVDFPSLERLVDWYAGQGVDGLFAVCQSSEMFFLSLEERVEVARFVKERAAIPVIASGHIADSVEEQITELRRMAETGIDALVLISNRLAAEDEGDDVFLARLERVLAELPADIPLGFYECPYPYKRLLGPQVIRYMVDSGRFAFIKDTSCDAQNMAEKLALIRGSRVKLYNANTATLLETLRLGAAGYSGVMANFHPRLYSWLIREYESAPEQAQYLQEILTMCSLIEGRGYPANAKYMMQLENVFHTALSRKDPDNHLIELQKVEVRQLAALSEHLCRQLIH